MSNFAVTLVRWHRHSVVRKLGVMNKVNTMSPPANPIWFRKSSYKMCLNSGAWFIYMLHAPRLKTVPDFIMQSWIRSRVKPNQFHQFVASAEVLCNRTHRENTQWAFQAEKKPSEFTLHILDYRMRLIFCLPDSQIHKILSQIFIAGLIRLKDEALWQQIRG